MRTLKTLSTSFALLLAVLALPAGADVCAVDERYGATLLLPYFEVDLDRGDAMTTLFSVNNGSAEPVRARVVLWTDAGYPTFSFDLDLKAFDVQQISLRNVFEGRLPETQTFADAPVCPLGPPLLPFSDYLKAAHTGQASPRLEGLCAGLDHKDNVARGYVTVDVIEGCEPRRPIDEGYFPSEAGGKGGVVGTRNVLWGDYVYFNVGTRAASGGKLVALEADPRAFGDGDATFYGSLVGNSGADAREPLPSGWSTAYTSGGALQVQASSIVWRDVPGKRAPFDCPQGPSWYPLQDGEVVNYDEDGNVIYWSTDVVFIRPPDPLAPAAAQLVNRARAFNSGWEILDLNPRTDTKQQSYVLELQEARGRYSLLRPATPLDNGCDLDSCAVGESVPVGELCVRKAAVQDAAVDVFEVRVRPEGCFSSCTVVHRAACDLREASKQVFDATAGFCLRSDAFDNCTADCEGGGDSFCGVVEAVSEGTYTVRAGGLELTFDPKEVDAEVCVGDRFES